MRTMLTLALALSAAACGGGSSSGTRTSSVPAQTVQGDSQGDLHGLCTTMFTRQRECTDQYLPALVDLRIRLDLPPGIAESAQTEGRDVLIAKAHEEWKVDSTDEKIAEVCTHAIADTSPEDAARLRGPVEACVAMTDCAAFVECIMPIHEDRFRAHSSR